MALHYIGGILTHARALNLFTNPTTNSYKRLVPGYEAPVLRAYSSRNRSAACRIPHTEKSNAKRVEVRFPDPTANPYLCYAAQLMAGLDGIKHEIDPGEAMDKDLYALPGNELRQIPTLCASLEEAVAAVEDDHDFLTQGDVFDSDVIAALIGLKREEITRLRSHPHPIEFRQYYSA
jgi:glutamine synthetase